jgi:NADH:ubiquinone oxidoreductase subunit 4 (subunit M)
MAGGGDRKSISIIITAAYIMINIRKVFFSPMPEKLEGHVGDVTVLDKVAIATLCFLMIVIGVFPAVMVPMVEKALRTSCACWEVHNVYLTNFRFHPPRNPDPCPRRSDPHL